MDLRAVAERRMGDRQIGQGAEGRVQRMIGIEVVVGGGLSRADEVVIVVGGRGELLINGEWQPVKQGDVHVCPRGIVHDTRALAENMQYISIFTPHLPPGTDINWVK